MKKCSHCGCIKSLEKVNFWPDKRFGDGFHDICRQCTKNRRQRKRAAALRKKTDVRYVRALLARGLGVPCCDVPEALVLVKQAQLKLKKAAERKMR